MILLILINKVYYRDSNSIYLEIDIIGNENHSQQVNMNLKASQSYAQTLCLKEMKPGSEYQLEDIPQSLFTEFIRLGLSVGDKIKCICRVPKGPVVLQKAQELTQIAIGEANAKQIRVCNSYN